MLILLLQTRGNQPVKNILTNFTGILGKNSNFLSEHEQYLKKVEYFPKRKKESSVYTSSVTFFQLALSRGYAPYVYIMKAPQTFYSPGESGYISIVLEKN